MVHGCFMEICLARGPYSDALLALPQLFDVDRKPLEDISETREMTARAFELPLVGR